MYRSVYHIGFIPLLPTKDGIIQFYDLQNDAHTMSEADRKEEEEKFFHIAKVNSYGKSLIEDIFRKQKRSLFIEANTTLRRI